MEFRYDFGEKLDLTRFRKQARHYIGRMREIVYNCYLADYKVVAEIATLDDRASTSRHRVTAYFMEVIRNPDGTIQDQKAILPLTDTRFREIKIIQDIFPADGYKTFFDSNDPQEIVDKLCNLISLVHKINHLKAFI